MFLLDKFNNNPSEYPVTNGHPLIGDGPKDFPGDEGCRNGIIKGGYAGVLVGEEKIS